MSESGSDGRVASGSQSHDRDGEGNGDCTTAVDPALKERTGWKHWVSVETESTKIKSTGQASGFVIPSQVQESGEEADDEAVEARKETTGWLHWLESSVAPKEAKKDATGWKHWPKPTPSPSPQSALGVAAEEAVTSPNDETMLEHEPENDSSQSHDRAGEGNCESATAVDPALKARKETTGWKHW